MLYHVMFWPWCPLSQCLLLPSLCCVSLSFCFAFAKHCCRGTSRSFLQSQLC
ncbi:hypothetical protein KC19_VG247400 [Ceratodon purpureus]|uniref:Uncharacterized protein n=1 Tax=Ceratodon purpureus TaxID=3225 RepID=A0A8T0HTB4_CERPU|nr:hypothetical protein KC19_VG247400 [Ceratodon purpureus]